MVLTSSLLRKLLLSMYIGARGMDGMADTTANGGAAC